MRKYRSEHFLHFSRTLSSLPFHFVPSCTIAHAWLCAHFSVLLILKRSSRLLAFSIFTFLGDDFSYRHRQFYEHLFVLFMLSQHPLCRYFCGCACFCFTPVKWCPLFQKQNILSLCSVDNFSDRLVSRTFFSPVCSELTWSNLFINYSVSLNFLECF